MAWTILLADDEPLARAGLRLLLAGDAEIGAIHEARNGREAVAAIRDLRPDLVFLDVQMPALDGFGVVREVGAEKMPAVVFVTAHDRYAVHAFEINAIDYLQKPVTADRFARALERAKGRLRARAGEDAGRQILSLLETIAAPKKHVDRVAVRAAGKTIFVDLGEVEWIEAEENYVQLHLVATAGRVNHLLQVTMNALERSLDPVRFVRVHRSIIVAVARISSLAPAQHGEYVITLASGAEVRSGRTYHEKLKGLLVNPF